MDRRCRAGTARGSSGLRSSPELRRAGAADPLRLGAASPEQDEVVIMKRVPTVLRVASALLVINMSSAVAVPTAAQGGCPDCGGRYPIDHWICTLEMFLLCGDNDSCEGADADYPTDCMVACKGYRELVAGLCVDTSCGFASCGVPI